MVVPKRAALLLDRIMVALHHALEDNDTEGIQRIANLHQSSRNSGKNVRYEKGMMQQLKGKLHDIRYCAHGIKGRMMSPIYAFLQMQIASDAFSTVSLAHTHTNTRTLSVWI